MRWFRCIIPFYKGCAYEGFLSENSKFPIDIIGQNSISMSIGLSAVLELTRKQAKPCTTKD